LKLFPFTLLLQIAYYTNKRLDILQKARKEKDCLHRCSTAQKQESKKEQMWQLHKSRKAKKNKANVQCLQYAILH